jgi:hypothetical protein
MALLSATFEFEHRVPPLEEIQSGLGIAGEEILVEGTHDLTPQDEASAKVRRKPSGNILFRDNGVSFRYRSEVAKKRRGITYIDLFVSLDGKKVVLLGNNKRLMGTLAQTLISLGGSEHPRK